MSQGERKSRIWANLLRVVLLFFMVLPLFFLFIEVFPSSPAKIAISDNYYVAALFVSFFAYVLSSLLKNIIFIKGEIPANTGIFIAELFLFPFILLFPPTLPQASTSLFIPLDVGMIIIASLYIIPISLLKKEDFPERDNLATFMLFIGAVVLFAISSMLFFGFEGYTTFGFVLGYLTIFMIISLTVYVVQLFLQINKVSFKSVFP